MEPIEAENILSASERTASLKEHQERHKELIKKYNEKLNTVAEHERELEDAIEKYELAAETLAKHKCNAEKHKEIYEQLVAETKLQRVRCKAMECDVILLQRENEAFEMQAVKLQEKARNLHQEFQWCLNRNQTCYNGGVRSAEDLETMRKLRQLYGEVLSCDEEIQHLSSNIGDKTKNLIVKNDKNTRLPSIPRHQSQYI